MAVKLSNKKIHILYRNSFPKYITKNNPPKNQ